MLRSVAVTRIAYLSYSSGEWDARTQRMARTAVDAGYDVTVYARWESGLPLEEDRGGYRVVRVPTVEDLAIPGRRGHGRKRLAGAYRRARNEATTGPRRRTDGTPPPEVTDRSVGPDDNLAWVPSRLRGTPLSGPLRAGRAFLRDSLGPLKGTVVKPVLMFPLRPMGWAIALEEVVEPADIWHGMWAGSLPALHRLRARFGGRTIYDSRDVYMRSRGFEQMGALKAPFASLERRWARSADAVLTVNDAYAALLAGQFGIETPRVVRNTPDRYVLPTERPDLIRSALGIPPDTRVVLYQGGLLTDRGIEQGMEAILAVENAVFVILGVGKPTRQMSDLAASDRLQGRVYLMDPVPPDQLLDWTAGAQANTAPARRRRGPCRSRPTSGPEHRGPGRPPAPATCPSASCARRPT